MDAHLERLEAILSPYLVVVKDAGVEYVSEALAQRLGVIPEELGKKLEGLNEIISPVPDGTSSITLTSAGNKNHLFSYTSIPLDDCRIIAFSEEPPNRGHIMKDTPKDILLQMIEGSSQGCLIVHKGLIVYTNEAVCLFLGADTANVLGRRIIDLVSKDNRRDFIKACEQWYESKSTHEAGHEIMFTAASGTRLHLMARGGWIRQGSSELLWITLVDVTEVRRLKQFLKEEQQKFYELFGRSPVGMLYINPRGRIIEANDYVAALMGYTRDQIKGSSFTKYVTQDQAENLREEFHALFTQGMEIKKGECVINTQSSRPVTIEYSAHVISRKGFPIKSLMLFNDITDKKSLELKLLEKNAEMERTLWDMAEVKDALEARAGELNKATEDLKLLNEKLKALSITDGLTEIYNHRHFQDRLSEEVERFHRQKEGVLSLLLLDIDDFKRVNDTFGHQCGDMVLRQIAGLLKNSVRTIDILARYGGEEFAVILPNANTDQAVVVAERICQTIRSAPFTFGEVASVKVTVSIGVGTITGGQGDKSELVRKADSALYVAKAKWKDRVEVWEED